MAVNNHAPISGICTNEPRNARASMCAESISDALPVSFLFVSVADGKKPDRANISQLPSLALVVAYLPGPHARGLQISFRVYRDVESSPHLLFVCGFELERDVEDTERGPCRLEETSHSSSRRREREGRVWVGSCGDCAG